MSDKDKKTTEVPMPEADVVETKESVELTETSETVEQNSHSELKNIIEAAIFAAHEPISLRKLQGLFIDGAQPNKEEVEIIIADLEQDYQNKGLELVRIGSGWRFQSREKYSSWLRKLTADKAPRYSRAQLETLSIIAYRQPVTRGDIEEVRGVSVSSDIIRILEERGWIREIGHRDVPGRPALFGTTQEFLSYFNLRSLKELPELIEQRKFEDIAKEMHMNLPLEQPMETSEEGAQEAEGDDKKTADIIPLHQDADELEGTELEGTDLEDVGSEDTELENDELDAESHNATSPNEESTVSSAEDDSSIDTMPSATTEEDEPRD